MNLTDNVFSLYRDASFASFSEGIGWYNDAQAFAMSLDTEWHRAAGVIAALSPMNSWANNKRKAAQLYAQNGDGAGCGLYRNVAKAVRIYKGEDALDVLGGDKVRNFFLTIVEPDRDDHIPVIDRHAFDIAEGRVTSDAERQALGRKGVYDTYAEAYLNAAARAGIPVQSLQAITWVEWRDRLGKGWAG
jgi:hypothetical protein